MAKLTKKDVLHVAELSNLILTDSEVKKLTPQLDKIIEFVGILNEIDTNGIEPTSQTTGLVNRLRVDVIDSTNSLKQDGYFKVPAILSKRT